jgi:hypothetical protein
MMGFCGFGEMRCLIWLDAYYGRVSIQKRMPRYVSVSQHSEEDCGAACISTVAQQHGKRLGLSRIRVLVGTGNAGTTLLGLRRGADAVGFHARAVRASPELIDHSRPFPYPPSATGRATTGWCCTAARAKDL